MTKPDSWMPLYIADYLADTAHLSTEEHGAYLLLIMHHWHKGAVPKNEKKLAKIARISHAKWRKISDTILEFFDDAGDVFVQPRVLEEIEKANKKYEARRAAGQKGGIAKAKQKRSNAKAGLNQPQPQPHSTNVESPLTPQEGGMTIGFLEFFREYPLQVSQRNAWRAWKRANADSEPIENILSAVREYAASGPEEFETPSAWLAREPWKSRRAVNSEALNAKWRTKIDHWQKTGEWKSFWGPMPGEPECLVPAALIPNDMPPISACLKRVRA